MKPALLLIMLLSFELFGQTQQRPTVALFEGARLIMGNGAALIESSAFIVENDRFTSVGRKANSGCRAARRMLISMIGRAVFTKAAHSIRPFEKPAPGIVHIRCA